MRSNVQWIIARAIKIAENKMRSDTFTQDNPHLAYLTGRHDILSPGGLLLKEV